MEESPEEILARYDESRIRVLDEGREELGPEEKLEYLSASDRYRRQTLQVYGQRNGPESEDRHPPTCTTDIVLDKWSDRRDSLHHYFRDLAGGLRWRATVYPRGTKTSSAVVVNLKIDLSSSVSPNWTAHVRVSATLVSAQPDKSRKVTVEQSFSAKNPVWGFNVAEQMEMAPGGDFVRDDDTLVLRLTTCVIQEHELRDLAEELRLERCLQASVPLVVVFQHDLVSVGRGPDLVDWNALPRDRRHLVSPKATLSQLWLHLRQKEAGTGLRLWLFTRSDHSVRPTELLQNAEKEKPTSEVWARTHMPFLAVLSDTVDAPKVTANVGLGFGFKVARRSVGEQSTVYVKVFVQGQLWYALRRDMKPNATLGSLADDVLATLSDADASAAVKGAVLSWYKEGGQEDAQRPGVPTLTPVDASAKLSEAGASHGDIFMLHVAPCDSEEEADGAAAITDWFVAQATRTWITFQYRNECSLCIILRMVPSISCGEASATVLQRMERSDTSGRLRVHLYSQEESADGTTKYVRASSKVPLSQVMVNNVVIFTLVRVKAPVAPKPVAQVDNAGAAGGEDDDKGGDGNGAQEDEEEDVVAMDGVAPDEAVCGTSVSVHRLERSQVVFSTALNMEGATPADYAASPVNVFAAQNLDDVRRMEAEAALLTRLSHANIVRCIGVCIDPGAPFLMVVERMHGGSLTQWMGKPHGKGLSERARLASLRNVAQALAYLHGRNPATVHGDVHPDNVLVADNQAFGVRLAGFSQARELGTDAGINVPLKMRGYFMAPEASEDDIGEDGLRALDVYAFGVTAWLLLSGEHDVAVERRPLPTDTLHSSASPEFLRTWRSCVSADPCQRPNMETVAHAFLAAEAVAREWEEEEAEDELLCILCQEEPKVMVMVPCGHRYACATCAFTQSKCAMCRAVVKSVVRLFE